MHAKLPNKRIKERKRVKKNTCYRNFRARVLRFEHRLMWDRPEVAVTDDAMHSCPHCKTKYKGGYCPTCSLPARWKRFTWKLLFLNFLDIWGLGNRPMFRTLRDLFWRPGYMMRDYLRGHHLSYFPPFKLLALLTVLLIFLGWIFNIELGEKELFADSIVELLNEDKSNAVQLTDVTQMMLDSVRSAEEFFNSHILYRILTQNLVLVLVVWAVFRRVGKLNLVETFFSQIYINSQFLIIGVILMVISQQFSLGSVFPYALPDKYSQIALIPLFLSCDFHQLYGVGWKSAVWRTLLVSVIVFAVYLAFMIIVMLSFIDLVGTLYGLGVLAMTVVAVYYLMRFFKRQKHFLNRPVYVTANVSLLPMIFAPFIFIGIGIYLGKYMGFLIAVIYIIFVTLYSLLTPFIYKKTHRTWLALLFPVLLNLAIFISLALRIYFNLKSR